MTDDNPFDGVTGGQNDDDHDEPPAITVGRLGDGGVLLLDVQADPEETETDTGPAMRTEAVLVETTATYEPDGRDPVEEGDEVVLITWGTRINRALESAFIDNGGLAGEVVRIDKQQGEGRFDVAYDATIVDGEDA